jgi:hypothetical protein
MRAQPETVHEHEAPATSGEQRSERDKGHVLFAPGNHALARLLGGGKPLARPVREEHEDRLGRNFEDVRMRTGPRAATIARAAVEKLQPIEVRP